MENIIAITCLACCKDPKRCELPVKSCTNRVRWGWRDAISQKEKKKSCQDLKEENKNSISLF